MAISEYWFKTISEEGERLGIPKDKKRALLREYLQTRIITALYGKAESGSLSFIGGTSLRLLRGLDRFSEDLGFDNLGLTFSQIKSLFEGVVGLLRRESFECNFSFKKTDHSGIGAIKFPKLLFELKVSGHADEKLSIKIDYTTPGFKPPTELAVLSRFGFVEQILTNTQEALLAEKFLAILNRRDSQPRDFYDAVWLMSRNISPDMTVLKSAGIKDEQEAYMLALKAYKEKIKPSIVNFKHRLEPFLINQQNIRYLEMFGDVVAERVN